MSAIQRGYNLRWIEMAQWNVEVGAEKEPGLFRRIGPRPTLGRTFPHFWARLKHQVWSPRSTLVCPEDYAPRNVGRTHYEWKGRIPLTQKRMHKSSLGTYTNSSQEPKQEVKCLVLESPHGVSVAFIDGRPYPYVTAEQ